MNKLSKILIYILLLLIGVLLFQNFLLRKNTDKIIKENNILPDNVKQEIVVKKDKVTIKEKKTDTKTGEVSVKTDIKYLPPEGNLKVTVKDDGDTDIKLTNKGFTFTPGLVIIPDTHFHIGVSSRLIYYKRLGAGIGGVISIEESPKPGAIGFIDYRFYGNFAVGAAYRESITSRGVGVSFTYYF